MSEAKSQNGVSEAPNGAPRRFVPPPKRYKIGEVMRATGLSRQTIHNYTAMGLISEVERTPSDHRLYDEGVFARLERIEELKGKHTLGEILAILESGGQMDARGEHEERSRG